MAVTKMVATLDESVYGRILARWRPRIIRNESDNDRALAEIERLDLLDRPLTIEEREYSELLTVLVQQFESVQYPLPRVDPVEVLRTFMEDRDLRQRDLVDVFGASSVVSDVLNGKRGISKAHAKKLAEFFQVSPALFI